jgi:D-alanyl-D-alanine dipeptidase
MINTLMLQYKTREPLLALYLLLFFSIFLFLGANSTIAVNIHNAGSNKLHVAKHETSALRDDFVYLDQIDPSIIVDIRYSSSNNLQKRPIAGIKNNRAVLTIEAALALKSVQDELKLRGYSLVVYNAYIPKQAYLQILDAFKEGLIDKACFPNISTEELHRTGYIREKIDNTRGSTIDVSIIALNKKLRKEHAILKHIVHNDNHCIEYLDDGSEDMGTSYDTFDELSKHNNNIIAIEAQMNRELLKEKMEAQGFMPSNLVWWKYTYAREPYLDSQFDFEI